jgi:hypothetical protein
MKITSIAPVVEDQGPDSKREFAGECSECTDALRSDALRSDRSVDVDPMIKKQRRKVPSLRAMAKTGNRGSLAVSAEVIASCAATQVSGAPTSPHRADLEMSSHEPVVFCLTVATRLSPM